MTTTIDNEQKTLNVPNLRFPEFQGEWVVSRLSEYLNENKERNKKGLFNKTDVLSVSGDFGIVNQIDLLGRSFAGASVLPYHVVRLGNIVYTKSPLKEFPYGIVKTNTGKVGIVSTLYAVYSVNDNANNKFIEYYFSLANRANRYFKPIVRIGAKHDMKIGNQEVLTNQVVFPTVKEQEKIADFLSLLDERISTQNKIIEKLQSLIKGISNRLLYADNSMSIRIEEMLIERSERTKKNNQYEILSSTVNGIFSQRDYFSKDIASDNNVGYKIIHLHDIVLSPQNLWMGNINFNDKFDIGIVSPSYKVFSIADGFDKKYVAALLKTHHALYNYMLVSEQGASIVRRNLNYEAFEQLVFKIPSLNKQQEIGHVISLLKSQLENANLLIKTYNSQKQYLLRQMFI